MSANDATVPALRANVDLTRMPLSLEEAYLASRIDGRTSVAQLAALVGKNAQDTAKLVKKLADLGVVTLGPASVPPSGRRSSGAPKDPYEGFLFTPAMMQLESDLDEESRKKILFNHSKLSEWSYYELLQISRRADPREIKKAYFNRSKEWHPDRFKRFYNLGAFKRLLDEIYRQVSDAFKTLSEPERRKEYDSTLSFEPDPDEIAAILKEQIEADRDERRDVEAKARRIKKNPILARFDRAKELYQQAVKLEEEGSLAEASRLAQMALTYDDRKVEYKELYERLRDQSADERLGPLIKRGRQYEAMAHFDDALELYEEAVRIAPAQAEARIRFAYTLLMAGRDMEEVMQHAQKAVILAGEDAEAHYVLGRVYESQSNNKLAKRHYEKALELKPNFQEAKKRLKRLKWGF